MPRCCAEISRGGLGTAEADVAGPCPWLIQVQLGWEGLPVKCGTKDSTGSPQVLCGTDSGGLAFMGEGVPVRKLPGRGGGRGRSAVELRDIVGRSWGLSVAPLNSFLAESRMTFLSTLLACASLLQWPCSPPPSPSLGGKSRGGWWGKAILVRNSKSGGAQVPARAMALDSEATCLPHAQALWKRRRGLPALLSPHLH